MKYTLILNACSALWPSRAKELYTFTQNNLGNFMAGATVIVHDGRFERQDLLENTFTENVILLKIDGNHPETALKILPDYSRDADVILFPADYFGEEISVRLACRLGGGSLVAAGSLWVENGQIFCGKKVYSQQLSAAFKMLKSPACVSIARSLGESEFSPHTRIKIVEADYSPLKPDFILSSALKAAEKTDDLAQAKRLIVAGKGVGSPEALKKLGELAEALGARLGVSRPVAMNAWAPLSQLVGVSGAMAKPELCLTFGVSGAAALYAGIEKSRFIISINRDPKAAMVRQSDAALIDDCAAVMEELQKIVAERQ